MMWFESLGLVVLVACGAPDAVSPSSATSRAPLQIVDVEQEGDALRLRWPDGLATPSGTFTLIDSAGAVGTVRVVGPSQVDCDDCHVTLVDVTWVTRLRACGVPCVAVGFGTASYSRARIVQLAEPDRNNSAWQPTLRIDLDGDGRWDLEKVARCGGTTPSGCHERVCNQWCSATRISGSTEPDRATIACFSFIPDLDDCDPSSDGT